MNRLAHGVHETVDGQAVSRCEGEGPEIINQGKQALRKRFGREVFGFMLVGEDELLRLVIKFPSVRAEAKKNGYIPSLSIMVR